MINDIKHCCKNCPYCGNIGVGNMAFCSHWHVSVWAFSLACSWGEDYMNNPAF